jgi:O-antigen/teichoic acid export membrane protein
MLRLQGAGTFVLSLALFSLAQPLVGILLGPEFRAAIPVLQWMAALPFIVGLSNIFGTQVMLNFDMQQSFTRVLVASGLINIALIVPLALWRDAEGVAISVLVTEVAVTVLMGIALSRRGLLAPIIRAETSS